MPVRRPASRVGLTLKGKWHLEAQIGSGGMATVYKASHRNGLRAAVKILHPHIAATPGMQERFLREGYVANRVEHPGAVRVLDDDQDDDLVFLVMELLEGETWKDRWAREGQKLSTDAVLDVAEGVLDVLIVAHAKGIVHRDIKPDNVFLTTEGRVKILDYGIARLKEGTGRTHATETGATLGTPAFMPPEQARSRWDEVDARCDIFALGATMWTMLTGKLVHEAKTLQELLIAAATEHVAPIAAALPSLPPRVAEVIDRALRFDRTERWPDATTMRAALVAARRARAPSRTVQIEVGPPAPAPQPAAAPTPAGSIPSFAGESITTRLLAEPLPAPRPASLPVVAPAPTAAGLAPTHPGVLATTEHSLATEPTAAGVPRSRHRLALVIGVAATLVCGAAWLGLRRDGTTTERAEPSNTAPPVAPAAAATTADSAASIDVSPGPIVEPAPSSEAAPPPSSSASAAPARHVAAPPRRPAPQRATPAVPAAPNRDPASVFGTH